mmetsp:Transcript_25751/g.56806  ORF Transcript_25751/g.56806 Transcript_25751/m.56806 type:complete len:85 (-) Transcript_25751:105-359(-)
MSWHLRSSALLLLAVTVIIWACLAQGLVNESLELPTYFGAALRQDLRHLLSFALGVVCVHTFDSWQSRQMQEPAEKFELHPFIM